MLTLQTLLEEDGCWLITEILGDVTGPVVVEIETMSVTDCALIRWNHHWDPANRRTETFSLATAVSPKEIMKEKKSCCGYGSGGYLLWVPRPVDSQSLSRKPTTDSSGPDELSIDSLKEKMSSSKASSHC